MSATEIKKRSNR